MMVKEEILTRLKNNFMCFFKQSIKHYVVTNRQFDDDVLAVFSLQQALEIMLKIYFVEKIGYTSILQDKFREKKESELINLLNSGNLKTIGYGDLLKKLKTESFCPLTPEDYDLIESFQIARNQIAHMGLDVVPEKLLDGILQLVTSVFTDLEYKDRINPSFEGELVNVLKLMLGNDLYNDFIHNTKLRTYSCKKAKEISQSEVHYCLECDAEAVIEEGYNYKCLLCGYSVSKNCATIIKCPECDSNNMYIDILNTSPVNDGGGHCPACTATMIVSQCGVCGEYFVPDCYSCSCKKRKGFQKKLKRH